MLQSLALEIACVLATVLALFAVSSRLQMLVQMSGFLLFGSPAGARLLYRVVVAPAVILHELSHALMALLLRVRVGRIELFRPRENGQLGAVWHERTDPVRGLLIGTAPVLAAILCLYGLERAFAVMLPALPDRPEPVLSALAGATVLVTLVQHASPLQTLGLFYVFFCLANTVLLSPSDLRDLKPLGVLALLVCGLFYALTTTGYRPRAEFLSTLLPDIALALNLAVFWLVGAVVADLLVVVIIQVVYTAAARGQRF